MPDVAKKKETEKSGIRDARVRARERERGTIEGFVCVRNILYRRNMDVDTLHVNT